MQVKRFMMQISLGLNHRKRLEMIRAYLSMMRPDMGTASWEACFEFLIDVFPVQEVLPPLIAELGGEPREFIDVGQDTRSGDVQPIDGASADAIAEHGNDRKRRGGQRKSAGGVVQRHPAISDQS